MKFWLLSSLVLLQFVTARSSSDDLNSFKRRTSNVCQTNLDCPLKSSCEIRGSTGEGLCVCQNGYFMRARGNGRECIEIADYGELCYLDEQCAFRLGLEAECVNSQCACKQGTHYVVNENACFNDSKIGDYCRLTSNCVVNGTTCKQGQCRCPYNYHSNWDKSICLRNISLGELCYSDEECIIEHSRCYGTCKCRSSHIPNSSGIQCLSVATALYQPCQESSQCSVPYSICSTNGTCICQPDHHDKKFACYVTVRLNEICEIDENCAIGNSHCDETRHRCVCDEGFHEVQGKFCSNAKTVQINLVVIILVFNVLRLL